MGRRASAPAAPSSKFVYNLLRWWRGLDSNQRRRTPADLQSAPFSHSGTPPPKPRIIAIGRPIVNELRTAAGGSACAARARAAIPGCNETSPLRPPRRLRPSALRSRPAPAPRTAPEAAPQGPRPQAANARPDRGRDRTARVRDRRDHRPGRRERRAARSGQALPGSPGARTVASRPSNHGQSPAWRRRVSPAANRAGRAASAGGAARRRCGSTASTRSPPH